MTAMKMFDTWHVQNLGKSNELIRVNNNYAVVRGTKCELFFRKD